MGFMGDKRPEQIGKAAAQAIERGLRVFTPQLEWPAATPGNAFALDDWARTVEMVESVGWSLTEWTVVPSGKSFTAFPVFRRPM
jgi:hypothetical protein